MSKAAMKRGRSSAINEASDNIDRVLRDSSGKQKLFMESHICTIYRITLLPTENFSENKALAYVDKHYRKRQAHCHGRLLEDRLTLERAKSSGRLPFRTWVGYKEIAHIYRSQSRPVYFVLCVNSQTSMKKYYEIYKCKTPEATQQVINKITTAMNDPDKMLRDPNVLRQVSVSYENRVRSLPQFDIEEERPISTVDIDRTPVIYQSPSPSPVVYRVPSPTPIVYRTPSPDYIPETVLISPKPITYLEAAPSPLPPSPKFKDQTDWINGFDDVTYISYDQNRQPFAAERGPIYMFLARRIAEQDVIATPGYPVKNAEYRNANNVYASPILYNGSY